MLQFPLTSPSNELISNFSMSASFGTQADTCTITVDQLQVVTQADDSFEISYLMEYADVEAELGEAVMICPVVRGTSEL